MAIFTAIGTAIAGSATLFGLSLAKVIATGLSFAAQLGFQYLNRPKKRKYTAIQGETQYGGDVAVGTLLGTGKTKGQRSFYAKSGRGNKYNMEVFLLANGWCDGLEPYVYFYGAKHNLVPTVFPGNHVAAYFVEGFGDKILLLFFDGRPGQDVDTNLVTGTAGLGQTWKATSVNAGIAYVAVHRTYHADLFSKGKPEFEFVLRGLREYDPRKDSTVVGGFGPQRINDPSTHTHTLNPAVHRLNYQLGLRALVSGRTLIGEGKSLGQLDLGSYFVAMNVCDSLRTDGKRTYQCSLFVTGDDDHTEILKEFDDAMAGYGLNRRGLSGVIAGAPQIPVLEITADDIPVDRAKEVQFRKSAFDRYNHLSGQFLSIEANWNPESLTPVYVNADVTADGRNRQTSNDFLQVTDPDIAQYLLNIRYRQNRRGGTATLPVSRRVGLKVQEGEWVVWRGKEWMISEWVLDEQFRVTLKLSETGADIYDDEDIEPGPVVIPPAPIINPSLLSTVQDFNVEAGMISSTGGQDTPCLRFTWSPPADPTITEVRISYRKHGETLELLATSSEPESGEFFTTDGVVSETLYNSRATITTVPDRLRTHTPWVTTVAPTGRMNVLDNSIIASKIATGAVIADKILSGAVTSLKLADAAVTEAKVAVNAINSTAIQDAAITNVKLGALAVDASKIAANAITTVKIADDAISTPKLLANAVVADKIAAKAVTAEKLIMGDFTNFIENPNFEEGDVSWIKFAGVSIVENAPADAFIGRNYMSIGVGAPATMIARNTNMFPVVPGTTFMGSATVKAVGGPNANLEARIRFMLADGTTFAGASSVGIWSTLDATYTTRVSATITAPAGAVYAWFDFVALAAITTGAFYVGATRLQRKNAAELIVDGSIAANHLAAASVTAGKIAAGTIVASDIAAATITGAKIAADTIGSNNIAAVSIYAKHLLLTDFTNFVPNGNFDSGDFLSTWNLVGSGGFYVLNGAGENGGNCALLQKTTTVPASEVVAVLKPSYAIPVQGGQIYYFETSAMTNLSPSSSGFYFRLMHLNASKVEIGTFTDVVANAPITSNWVKYSGKITLPTTCKYLVVQLFNSFPSTTTNLFIDRVIIRKANAAELIVDGSITAQHISVTSLSAISANLGSVNISSAIIGTLTVGTSNIAAGAITEGGIAEDGSDVSVAAFNTGNWTTLVERTVNHGTGSPQVAVDVAAQFFQNQATPVLAEIFNVSTGVTLRTITVDVAGIGGSYYVPFSYFGSFYPASGVASTLLRFRARVSSGTTAGSARSRAIRTMTYKR